MYRRTTSPHSTYHHLLNGFALRITKFLQFFYATKNSTYTVRTLHLYFGVYAELTYL
ncbi:hypothetical protein GGP51_001526 [Salinibacter ruber]|nr:hypothetical protein [Salinibacter ruber]